MLELIVAVTAFALLVAAPAAWSEFRRAYERIDELETRLDQLEFQVAEMEAALGIRRGG